MKIMQIFLHTLKTEKDDKSSGEEMIISKSFIMFISENTLRGSQFHGGYLYAQKY